MNKPESENPVLSLNKVSYKYPDGPHVLNDVSISLFKREIVCILGASGCGKTTLLNIAASFLRPSDGRVFFLGKPDSSPGPGRIMVFQDMNQLFPWLDVKSNILLPVRSRGLYSEKAEMLLELVGLTGFADYYPARLSGGMKQRAVIARALISDPGVLLLDEPFTALDAPTRKELQKMIRSLKKGVDSSVMFVTHDIREAVHIADRVVIMGVERPEEIDVNIEDRDNEFSDEFIALERKLYSLLMK